MERKQQILKSIEFIEGTLSEIKNRICLIDENKSPESLDIELSEIDCSSIFDETARIMCDLKGLEKE